MTVLVHDYTILVAVTLPYCLIDKQRTCCTAWSTVLKLEIHGFEVWTLIYNIIDYIRNQSWICTLHILIPRAATEHTFPHLRVQNDSLQNTIYKTSYTVTHPAASSLYLLPKLGSQLWLEEDKALSHHVRGFKIIHFTIKKESRSSKLRLLNKLGVHKT